MHHQRFLKLASIRISFFCYFIFCFVHAEELVASPQVASLLRHVDKPAIAPEDQRARVQPAIPDGWKEVLFEETAPMPVATREETARGFILFQRPITRAVHLNTRPLPQERCTELSVFATPGEWEPTCFTLYPLRDLKNIRTQVSALQTTNGLSIPVSAVDVRLLTYWDIRYPLYYSKGTYRRLPELLEKVTVNDATAGECQRYWVRIHVPKEAAPGMYSATLTLWSDAFEKALAMPISVRVLPFTLKQDPAKHYSAYYGGYYRLFDNVREDLRAVAATNEFQAMVDYGLNTLPTCILGQDPNSYEFYMPNPQRINQMISVGLKGPFPVTLGIGRLFRKYMPDTKIQGHYVVDKFPPEAFYTELTELIEKFVANSKNYEWPEMFCCPMDEVNPSSAPFAARAYKAVRAGGLSTYITKDPTSFDTNHYRDLDAVDAWCSQPYSMPYEKVVADQRYQYWSYPNHNAGEIKNREVMCKGGRMTYGFGFWRSGYTVLIPWHWRWIIHWEDPFNYLRGSRSGCGQRMTEEGEIIPAVYWECFREGVDDNRYIYTLQSEIVNREGSTDVACQAVLVKAKAFLQKTWDDIRVQEKYLNTDIMHDNDFDNIRWRIAQLIQELRQFPLVREAVAPSVIVAESARKTALGKADPFQSQELKRHMDILDLGDEQFSKWTAVNSEASMTVTPAATHHGKLGMRFVVNVDHKVDGEAANGVYPIGWPRVRLDFLAGKVDLSQYDYFTFWIRVASNRDEVADDITRFGMTFGDRDSGAKYDKCIDLGGEQGRWMPIRISLADYIRESGATAQRWMNLRFFHFYIAEAWYAHGNKLIFDIDQISLVKFKTPILHTVNAPEYLRASSSVMTLDCELFGARSLQAEMYTLRVAALDAKGQVVAIVKADPALGTQVVLPTESLRQGEYTLQVDLLKGEGDSKKRVSSVKKTLIVLSEKLSTLQ
ncbi:MAG: hypothetical protein WC340_12795 [Kiritimatiellia bacterium]